MTKNLTFFLYFATMYAVTPNVLVNAFNIFVCDDKTVKGRVVLRKDHSIECSGYSYDGAKYFAIVIIVFFSMLVPLSYYLLLGGHLEVLNPPAASRKQSIILRDRNLKSGAFSNANHLLTLFRHYVPRRWWFEVGDTYRRVFISCVVLAAPKDTLGQSIVAFFAAVFGIGWLEVLRPYAYKKDHYVAQVASWQYLLTTGLVMLVQTQQSNSWDSLGVLLIIVNILCFLLQAALSIWDIMVALSPDTAAKIIPVMIEEPSVHIKSGEGSGLPPDVVSSMMRRGDSGSMFENPTGAETSTCTSPTLTLRPTLTHKNSFIPPRNTPRSSSSSSSSFRLESVRVDSSEEKASPEDSLFPHVEESNEATVPPPLMIFNPR